MRRIYSARAASRFPALYVMIRSAELSLTAVSRLEPHLTAVNFDSVVSRAAGKRQREIEAIIVELVAEKKTAEIKHEPEDSAPMTAEIPLFEDVSEAALPSSSAVSAPPRAPAVERPRDTVRLEAPGVVRVSFQASEKLRRDLERLKELLKRSCETGRLEEILERVVGDFLARNDPARRRAATQRPPRRRQTRRIPRWVKDRVWRRDEGRCSFASPDGNRCTARSGLELDHVVPWARGGASDDPANVRLLCRAHNLFHARRTFGAKVPSGASA